MTMNQPVDLSRFTEAQKRYFSLALGEILRGKKQSHWIWYIFPVIQGFRNSKNHRYYAIKSLEEAKKYMEDSYLGENMLRICQALLDLPTNDPVEVFGSIDDIKVQASMTLFALADVRGEIFRQVLAKFFRGEPDPMTMALLDIPDHAFLPEGNASFDTRYGEV